MSLTKILEEAASILGRSPIVQPARHLIEAWSESGKTLKSCQSRKHWEHTPDRLGVMDDGSAHPYAGLCHNPVNISDSSPFTMLSGDCCGEHEFRVV